MSRKKNEITILCKSSARVGTDAFVRPCGPDVSGRRALFVCLEPRSVPEWETANFPVLFFLDSVS